MRDGMETCWGLVEKTFAMHPRSRAQRSPVHVVAARSPRSEISTPHQRVAAPSDTLPEPATPLRVKGLGRLQLCRRWPVHNI
jgi:hypothetical protein